MILAATPDSTAAAGTFWSAMLTTIPVLALALSVEAGRQMRHSENVSWRVRLFTTVTFLGYGTALVVSFYISVDALAHEDGFERAALVGALLAGSLLILVGAPLGDIALRTNPEIWTVVGRITPWSHWRRQRRQLRKALKDMRHLRDKIESGLARRAELLQEVRAAIADGETSRVQLDALRRFRSKLPPGVDAPQEWAEVERAVRSAEVEVLRPGSMLGRLEFKLETLLLSRAEALELRDKVDHVIRKMEVSLRGYRLFRFDHVERLSFRRQIASLHQEFTEIPTP